MSSSPIRNIVGAKALHCLSVGGGGVVDKRVGQFGVPNGVKSLMWRSHSEHNVNANELEHKHGKLLRQQYTNKSTYGLLEQTKLCRWSSSI